MSGALDDRIALVTGASRGIGAACAKALAAEGAHVVLVARDTKALEAVEQAIYEAGGSATIAPLDLTEGESIARLAQAVRTRWGRLDLLLIGAANLPTLGPVPSIDPKEFSQAVTLNLLGTQALIAAFDPLLRASKAGAKAIGLTSSVGAHPRAHWGAYGSTKAAFDCLLESWSRELGEQGSIRVTIVDPGATRTAMRAKAFPGEDPQSVKPPEAVAARIVALATEDFPNGHRERVEGG